MTDNLNDIEYPLDVVTLVNDISDLNEWWLVSMPIPMEPQRQAIENLVDFKSLCDLLWLIGFGMRGTASDLLKALDVFIGLMSSGSVMGSIQDPGQKPACNVSQIQTIESCFQA